MVVFVRESRSGVGVGACCEGFALGSFLDIIGGTCCKGAICIETAREGQWEDKQLLLRKRRKHLVPFVFMDDLCRPPQLLFPNLVTSSPASGFASLINSVILLESSPYCPTITKSLSGASIVQTSPLQQGRSLDPHETITGSTLHFVHDASVPHPSSQLGRHP